MKDNLLKVFLLFFLCLLPRQLKADDSLLLHYTFEQDASGQVNDISGNGHNAVLLNGAKLKQLGEFPVADLGSANGYIDMGPATGNLIAGLEDFSIAINIFINPATNITGNGNFIWAFSTHDACNQTSGKYIAYRVNRERYALSTGGWGSERVGIETGNAAAKGSWVHVVYTQSGTTGTIYLNGVKQASGTASYKPKAIGEPTTYNWLGRPPFSGDDYLKNTLLSDFRIYNRALNTTEITDLCANQSAMNTAYQMQEVTDAKNALELENPVRYHLDLPAKTGDNIAVEWMSDQPEVISAQGIVNRPVHGQPAATVTLTAILSKNGYSETKIFVLTVLPSYSDAESVAEDADNLTIDNTRCRFQDIYLPVLGSENSVISWSSDQPEYFSDKGEVVSLPEKGSGNVTVILTATVTKGNVSQTRNFEVCIAEDEGFSSYLFVYFTGNSGTEEAIRFAVSNDGYNYTALNSNLPIIASDTISNKGGVRDPHILRGIDGKTYYMVVTDMKSSQGWTSNHGIVLMKSTDLVNWTHHLVDIKATFPAFSKVNRAWAPQTIYDPEAKKYMIYFSLNTSDPGSYDTIYYAYANDDFTALESAPKVLYDRGLSTIDGDIIYKDGKYNLFFKTEGSGNGIKKAVASSLTGSYEIKEDKYLQQTPEAVEGSCVFKLINSDKYILMYDLYTSGKYQFTESTDLSNFSLVQEPVSMNFAPRHGTVIPITKEEAVRLGEKWAQTSNVKLQGSVSKAVKPINVELNETKKTLYLPVRYGTDLANFDPELVSFPGVQILPEGAQDFTAGPVTYTLSLRNYSVDYTVTASNDNNPVLEGYYADAEILYAEKTGKYYIYPTSDGFSGWSGTYFKVFSSDNLVQWTDEGVMLNLPTDVSWASTNAWAPCIVEKKISDTEYKYYYYFTAAQKVGVAVADNPTGPFVDSGKALISSKPAGVSGGQEIDPDVFHDPVSGKYYLYWGNGYMAGVELNDDMVSVKTSTLKVMTPNSTFREGTYAIYRNGTYYFFWSEDDTRSQNYRVRYGTSNSPLGAVTVPSNNLILQKDAAKGIYGTGHNSVVQVPGTDQWYIVYHRFTRPKGIEMGDAAGFNREVCIDKLKFNADGSIQSVIPTLEGISPLGDETGIEQVTPENTGNKLELYPNPAKGILRIRFSGSGKSGADVYLYASNGAVLQKKEKQKSNELTLNIETLPRGIYFVKVRSEGKTYSAEFIKD
jgi:hypothetical protein